MKKKKGNNKKFLATFLLLFAIAGVIGYGAYSYYWTDGSVTSGTQHIEVSSFNPTFYVDGSHEFINSTQGSISLSCPSTSSGSEQVECTGSISVYNQGDSDITVEIDSSNSGVSTYGSSSSLNASITDVDYDWSSTTISPGSSETLYVTVYVDIDNGLGSSASVDNPEYVTSAVPGGTVNVTANLKIIATQVH